MSEVCSEVLSVWEIDVLRDLIECEDVYGGLYTFEPRYSRMESLGLIWRPDTTEPDTYITDKGRALVVGIGHRLREEEKSANLDYKSWKTVFHSGSGYVEEQSGFYRLSIYDMGDVWPVRPMEDVFRIRMDGPYYFRSLEECKKYLEKHTPEDL